MRAHLRPAAIAAATLVGLLTAAPAYAADVTGGSASAVTLTAGDQDNGTGTYSAQYDNAKTTSGSNKPAISLLGGQSLISAGTLAQDADADANGSKACAGLAGQGATLARVGDGNCLVGGDAITLDAGHVDLSKLTIDDGTFSSQLPPELSAGFAQITTAVGDAFKQALTSAGSPGLKVNLGVIEGECRAGAAGADGEARLANANVQLVLPEQANQDPVTLLTLPAKPAPNSDYSADLGKLAELIRADFKANLEQSFQGSLAQLVPVADQAAVLSAGLTEVSKQLQPVTGQVIKIVANAQTTTPTSIDLTALDIRLLPGQVQGADAFRLRIGHVQCGPTTQAVVSPPEQTTTPKLPTAVSAGESGTPGPNPYLLPLTGLALLAAGSIGLAGWRGARR